MDQTPDIIEEPSFDSSFLVAFKLSHEALDSALKKASSLNITQYRVLVKLFTAGELGLTQKQLGSLLGLAANVVTQSMNVLVDKGLAIREDGGADKRLRFAKATKKGGDYVARVNETVIEQLYTLFPSDDDGWRRILEAAIYTGAEIDPPLSQEFPNKYSASRTLVSIELVRLALEKGLREACGAPFSDCLVMMRLSETDKPLRVSDLSEALETPAANITRAVDRLVARGWVQRMGSDQDRKAVFTVPTAEGEFQARIIVSTSNKLVKKLLWSKLSPADQVAIGDVGNVVIEGLRQRKAEAKNVTFEDLKPF